ncbi:phosphotransferase enzyme family protein [Chryseobacterium polytrichastri]|uniref:Phosphotransferase enzyme family protein n=1 Tax=Chryseobacterium polytrichastri TaxID=1302687 RepID=A0A1M6UVD7_9FLAO|nr:aminoglycoside phosphotransferase family protein [Chryseobacterium polytrichastri]SHK73187.1 Phosphotransferase enzyme family protein [Chryseobacterium polytrichastri]
MEVDHIVKKFIATENYTLHPIINGLINVTFIVENKDTHQKYILQKINNQVFKNTDSIIINHLQINCLLQSNDYQLDIIKPILSLSKEFLVQDENLQPWRMQSFVEDSVTFIKVPSSDIAFEAAKAFSHFLDVVNTGTLPNIEDTLPNFLNFEKRVHDYQEALKNADPQFLENANTEIELTNQFLSLPNKWIEMVNNNQLPKRIIHADAKISNILFDENHEALAVIDLDTVMVSTILYDFGTMIQSYTNTTNEDDGSAENNFNPEIYNAVKNGFLFHLKETLTPEESNNLDYAAQVAIYIQEIRFLTDYLNGSIYYSTKYPEHNLDRTKNQLELLKGLNEFLGWRVG